MTRRRQGKNEKPAPRQDQTGRRRSSRVESLVRRGEGVQKQENARRQGKNEKPAPRHEVGTLRRLQQRQRNPKSLPQYSRRHHVERGKVESIELGARRSRRQILHLDGKRHLQIGRTLRHLDRERHGQSRLQPAPSQNDQHRPLQTLPQPRNSGGDSAEKIRRQHDFLENQSPEKHQRNGQVESVRSGEEARGPGGGDGQQPRREEKDHRRRTLAQIKKSENRGS